MHKKIPKTIRCILYTFFSLLLIQNLSFAQNGQKSDEVKSELEIFFGRIVAYMNQKNAKGVSNFLRANARDDLEIVKKIIKISDSSSSTDPQLDVQDVTMNIGEYETFLSGFFGDVVEYAINYRITGVQYEEGSGIIFANVEFREYATIRQYDGATARYTDKKIYINSNCSYSFAETSGLPQMYYNNCAEKIVRN